MPVCALCDRTVKKITRHHLVPKQKGGTDEDVILLCQPCHKTLHATFSNTELVQTYNTLEQLRAAEPLQRYLKWIRKRDIEHLRVRRRKH